MHKIRACVEHDRQVHTYVFRKLDRINTKQNRVTKHVIKVT